MKILFTYWVIMMILHEVAGVAMGCGIYRKIDEMVNDELPKIACKCKNLGWSEFRIKSFTFGLIIVAIITMSVSFLLTPITELLDILYRISRKILLL